jgi:hypothetical protein
MEYLMQFPCEIIFELENVLNISGWFGVVSGELRAKFTSC